MAGLTASNARETFSDMVNRAAYGRPGRERGKAVAARGPVKGLELL